MLWCWIYNSYSTIMPIIKAKLIEHRNEFGGYKIYVFENLNYHNWEDQYIMTVRFPNWQCPELKKGDIGFLNYNIVNAGESKWWDKNEEKFHYYNYTNIVFQDFVFETKKEDLQLKCD